METGEFFDKIEAHPELKGLGVKEEEPVAAVILHEPSGDKFEVLLDSVEQNSWEELEGVLVGKRDAKVLSHMTRVVGYFSKVENWNRSKVGELASRQSGDYTVS
jgi:hypothetical protein